MFCSKCGKQLNGDSVFCMYCGSKMTSISQPKETVQGINTVSMPQTEIENNTFRKRHGFTSFWLIFGIVANAFSALYNLFLEEMYNASQHGSILNQVIGELSDNFRLLRFMGIVSLIGIVGYVFLLKWKKIGFWLFCGVAVIALVLNIIMGVNAVGLITGLAGVPILYGILRIKKNGKSTWEQLG
jgi:hypothetical protein